MIQVVRQGPRARKGRRGEKSYPGPTGPAVILSSAQYVQRYPAEQTERLYQAGKTMKFNTEITSGAPYIRYDLANGTFTLIARNST